MRRNNNNVDPAWTAKRCQHLLRQLVVPISVLRRELDRDNHVVKKTPIKRVADVLKEEHDAPVETPPTAGKDPDWMPKPGRKKSRFAARRYAGRNTRKRQDCQAPERRSSN